MIQIDWNYGVRFLVNENSSDHIADLTLHIDPQREDVIAALYITVPKDRVDISEQEADELMQSYNTKLSVMKEKKCTYVYPQKEGTHEFIRLNLFLDDDTDISAMIKWLGLEKEFEDGLLYYEEELLKSENFRYKWILKEGHFEKNISSTGDSKYDYSSNEK